MYSVLFDLSTKISIEQRTVKSIPVFFGNIGGLRDFLFQILALILGPLTAYGFKLDKAGRFFRMGPPPPQKGKSHSNRYFEKNGPQKIYSERFESFKLSGWLRFKLMLHNACCMPCLCSKRDR